MGSMEETLKKTVNQFIDEYNKCPHKGIGNLWLSGIYRELNLGIVNLKRENSKIEI